MEEKFDSCKSCRKITPIEELVYNSKFGGYNFKEICDNCAFEIDDQQDSERQDK